MRPTIRPFKPDDYPAVVAVHNVAMPGEPTTVERMRDRDEHRHPQVKCGRWIAEREGRIVGVGEYTQSIDLYHPQKFQLILYVHPNYRRQGIGSALYDHLTRELEGFHPIGYQARTPEDNTAGLRFLQVRGFGEDFRQWESHLDVALFDLNAWMGCLQKVEMQGIKIKTLAALRGERDWERRLFELDREIEADVPSPPSISPLEEDSELQLHRYVEGVLANPDYPPEAYFVAIREGEYIGLSYSEANPDAGTLDIVITGVKRAYRGRGIATALKLRGIAYAQRQGYTTIRTWNDTVNRPILALNDKLGYVRQPALIFFERELGRAKEGIPTAPSY